MGSVSPHELVSITLMTPPKAQQGLMATHGELRGSHSWPCVGSIMAGSKTSFVGMAHLLLDDHHGSVLALGQHCVVVFPDLFAWNSSLCLSVFLCLNTIGFNQIPRTWDVFEIFVSKVEVWTESLMEIEQCSGRLEWLDPMPREVGRVRWQWEGTGLMGCLETPLPVKSGYMWTEWFV